MCLLLSGKKTQTAEPVFSFQENLASIFFFSSGLYCTILVFSIFGALSFYSFFFSWIYIPWYNNNNTTHTLLKYNGCTILVCNILDVAEGAQFWHIVSLVHYLDVKYPWCNWADKQHEHCALCLAAWLTKPRHTAVTLGQDLVVDCRAVSEVPSGGQLTYTWLFNQSAVQPRALLMANASLFVPRVGREDEGEYTCVVREDQGTGQVMEVQATAQVVIACELKVQFLLTYWLIDWSFLYTTILCFFWKEMEMVGTWVVTRATHVKLMISRTCSPTER